MKQTTPIYFFCSSHSMAATASGMSAITGSPNPTVDSKVLNDLNTLIEKMELCDNMLHPGAGEARLSVKTSEAMLAVVGFLEACAPRMVELVEAAAQGALSEDIFAQCLSVNDRLQKLLSDVDTAALTETSAETTAASAPPAGEAVVEDQFQDLLLEDDDKSKPLETTAFEVTGKSTGEEEEDFKPAGIAKSSSMDEFDDFFAERTNQS
jgi:hypothetical protein